MLKMKRCISMLLVLGILLGILAPTVQAATAKETATVNTDNVTIQGTNDLGNLLSQEIIQSKEEAAEEASEYTDGYTVTDLEIEDGVATVTYDSMEEARLVVALYTEDGLQLLTSAAAIVSPDETTATIEFDGQMPDYFMASAYLLDSYDFSPLCAAYDTPMYTREMQELLASTVDDYDDDKVLNLDEDDSTNFAVYADSTIVIEAEDGVNIVASIDEENATYVINNADEQITSLTAGNVFVYPYAEGEILIVKVASILVSGTTASITGTELELEEVFAYLKVESDADTADMVVDDSTAAEGITYVGLSEEEISPQAWEGGGSANASHTFKVDIEKKKESNHLDASFSVTGSLKVSINVGFNYYISLKRQFIEFKATPSVTLGVTITGNVTGKFPIGNFGVSPVAGVYIGFSPEIQLKFDGTAELSANVSMTIGFGYSSDKGFENLTTKPKVTFNLSVEGTLFFGVDFNPNAKIIHEKVASFKVGAAVGFELTAKMSGTLFEYFESDAEKKHTCTACLGLDVAFKATLDGELKFLDCDWLTLKVDIASLTFNLGSWHRSSEESGFKKGECENYIYRLTIHVKDKAQKAVAGATVTVDAENMQTNNRGNAVIYLPKGSHTITASEGELSASTTVKLDDARKVNLTLKEEGEEEDFSELWESMRDFTDGVDFGEALQNRLATFGGHTYALFDGPARTWNEANAFCESLGGHLATITSARENEFLYDYMVSQGYRNAYWGLTDEAREDVWRWCTGETVTYTNWGEGEPNNDHFGAESFGMFWDGVEPGQWNDGFFGDDGYAFLCEWDYETVKTNSPASIRTGNTLAPNAVYPGDNKTEETDSYTLKTASFKDLVPGEQYVMLSVASVIVEDPLNADNLLFVDQAVALEDGTLVFEYVQRTSSEVSYVMACGASHKNLKNAEITFPEMVDHGDMQVVEPVVVYDGETLTEGKDYVITGTVDYDEAGTFVCYVRGIRNYSGLVKCEYEVAEDRGHTYTAAITEPTCSENGYTTYTCECGDSYVANETPTLPHTEVPIPAVDATYDETGLTEGTMCSVCGEIVNAQQTIPMLDYNEGIIPLDVLTATAGDYETDAGSREGPAYLVLDEDFDTIWHTSWNGTSRENHWIQFEIAGDYTVTGLRYKPRVSGNVNGIITRYDIQVSNDGVNFISVDSDNWEDNRNWKIVEFDGRNARYVRLVSLDSMSESYRNVFATAAEIRLIGFEAGDQPHEHAFSEWSVTTEPTCAEKGVEARLCECGEFEIREIPALPHTEENLPAREATFDEPGLTEGMRCSVCGEILIAQQTIPMLDYNEGIVPLDVLTATAGDYEMNGGSSEGPAHLVLDGDFDTIWHTDWYGTSRENHWIQFEIVGDYAVTGLRYKPRTGNSNNGTITEYKIQVSTNGVDFVDVITGSWDSNQNWKIAEFDAKIAKYVRLVSLNSVSDHATKVFASAAEIRLVGVETSHEHSFEDCCVTVEPTCTEDGSGTQTCSSCGYSETIVLPALGHDFVDGVCTRCCTEESADGPNIVTQPTDYVGLIGDIATFTVVAEGEGLSYQWYYYESASNEWKKSGSGTSATLSVEYTAYRNNQQYRCEITDANGSTVTTNIVRLTPKSVELIIVTQPVDYVGSVNDELSFAVEAIGNGLTYQWYYSDNAGETWKVSGTPGFNTATLYPILRAYRDGYQYKCQITDIFGNKVTSAVVSATVKSSAVIISEQPKPVTNGVLDQLHSFTVEASGDNLEYRWEYSTDGGETWQLSWNQGYNAPTLTVRLYAYRSGYLYRCQITSGLKTVVYTEPVELTLQAPSANIVKQPSNVAVVTGKTASFPVQVTGNDLTYQWYRSNDNGATWAKTYLGGYNTAALSFVANASRAALYKCQITDGSGQVVWSNVVKLQILSAELKILSQPVNVTCASGATATFTVEAQGDTLKYQWYASSDGGATWTASYLTGYNTNTFSFAVNAARAAKLYKCVITDAGGNTVETDYVAVTIG